ncbi:MAG: hypothetical protein AAFY98_02195, partial [Verrucomicrobiota bacterium]
TIVYRPFLLDGDMANYQQLMWNLEKSARAASTDPSATTKFQRNLIQTEKLFTNATVLQRIQMIYSLTACPAVLQSMKRFMHMEPNYRQLRTALALEGYHLIHGNYPDKLSLLENIRPLDLIDPVTNEPMIYRLDPERGYVLYSRGENGVDDGGHVVPRKDGETGYRERTAPDWVWPRPMPN